jgi:UDP-N-acetylglucosamine:LPS N-acetylglucosamine transferase
MKNCEYLQNNNAAIVINQENLTQDYLASVFLSLIKNANITKELKKNVLKLNMKDSTKNICDEIINNMRNN